MKKTIYLILFIVAVCMHPSRSEAESNVQPPRNPNSAKACAICHYRWVDTFFIEGKGSDLVDYTSEKVVATPEMCFSCHDGSVADSRARAFNTSQHKTNVPPPAHMKIPDVFPLDEKGYMQCATCHTAHGVPSGPDSHETIFMRTSNRNSAMCRRCHPDMLGGAKAGNHPVDTTEQRIPKSLINIGAAVGSRKNQVICETCHTAHGSPSESYLIKSGRDSRLCLACHQDKNSITPKGRKRPVHVVNIRPGKAKIPADLAQRGARFGYGGELICQSCHKVHTNKNEEQLLIIEKGVKSAFCFTCHLDKHNITETKHNLLVSAPKERNLEGKTVAQAGICSACHLPHKAARKLTGKGDFTARLCRSCHSKGNVAEKVNLAGNTHPLDVYPFKKRDTNGGLTTLSVEKNNLKLPLFNKFGIQDKYGKITCSTCHDTHRLPQDGLAAETGNKSSGQPPTVKFFLRKPLPDICGECHRDKFAITDSKHNLRNSAPGERNIQNQTPAESGLCGTCHLVHGSHKGYLWARKINAKDDIHVQGLCISCHNETGIAKKKVNKGVSHPINISPLDTGTAPGLPLFDKNEKHAKGGVMTCQTCHDPHRWRPVSTTEELENDGNSSKDTSFLRKPAPRICGECHPDKFQIAGSKHDLSRTAPKAENIQNQTASQSGLCGSCHLVHNARPAFLWARNIEPGSDSVVQDLCIECHNPKGMAQKKALKGYSHPMNISVSAKGLSSVLPLYDRAGKIARDGMLTCHTCHDPHRWDPLQTRSKDTVKIEGNAQNSFLRLESSPAPKLCESCHTEQATIEKTDHDLTVTAPFSKNIRGQTPLESGTCGVCHLTHNSQYQLKLWAQDYAGGDSTMEMMCNSCHSKNGAAKNKIPLIASHPEGKLIINTLSNRKGRLNYFPLFDRITGKKISVGNISCPSCHNAHQWKPRDPSKGAGIKVEGTAGSSFLRMRARDLICKDCHGPEAIYKYLYFHYPDKRISR
jgi:predicted CXXCH cytochrome family protein